MAPWAGGRFHLVAVTLPMLPARDARRLTIWPVAKAFAWHGIDFRYKNYLMEIKTILVAKKNRLTGGSCKGWRVLNLSSQNP